MSLYAKSAGWEDDPETGARQFIIRLVAEYEHDIPALTADDVWQRTPLHLTRALQAKEGGQP